MYYANTSLNSLQKGIKVKMKKQNKPEDEMVLNTTKSNWQNKPNNNSKNAGKQPLPPKKKANPVGLPTIGKTQHIPTSYAGEVSLIFSVVSMGLEGQKDVNC